MPEKNPALLAIIGPTASGKTSLAVAAARILEGEIISADSRQVYRNMNIGTGKDLHEYGTTPYHLIDIVDAQEEFHLFAYQKAAYAAIKQICTRKKLPVLCGGTGLYLDAVLHHYELEEAPENPELRQKLAPLSDQQLREKLMETSTNLHNTTDLLERERMIRAIEIAQAKPVKINEPPPFDPFIYAIRWPREQLRERIRLRLRQRLQSGMIEEVGNLLQQGVSHQRLDLLGLEYRFISHYLQGSLNRNDMEQKLHAAICKFAKRQETWFRRMERRGAEITWLDAEEDLLPQLLSHWHHSQQSRNSGKE